MTKYLLISGFAVLTACGVPQEEEISSKSDFQPLGQAFFVPVDPTALEQSEAWAEVVESYR